MRGWVFAALGAIGVIMIETSVEDARSNISGWHDLFEYEPEWANTVDIDSFLRFPVYGLLILGLFMLIRQHSPKEQNKENTPVIDNSVRSENQKGGITAHNVNIGNTQRTMPDDLGKELLKIFDIEKKIDIIVAMNDPEAECYAIEIKKFLQMNKYEMLYNTMLYESMSGGRGVIAVDISKDVNNIIVGSNVDVSDEIRFLGSQSRPA